MHRILRDLRVKKTRWKRDLRRLALKAKRSKILVTGPVVFFALILLGIGLTLIAEFYIPRLSITSDDVIKVMGDSLHRGKEVVTTSVLDNINSESAMLILSKAIPFLQLPEVEQSETGVIEFIFGKLVNFVGGFGQGDARTVMGSGLVYLGESSNERLISRSNIYLHSRNNIITQEETIIEEKRIEDLMPTIRSLSSPEILVYHAHTSESYADMSGVTHTTGTVGDIVEIGKEFSERLMNVYGIPVIHEKKIHDYPNWSMAYINALNTVQLVLKENPSIEMVFDLHRDGFERDRVTYAMARQEVTGIIDGEQTARILIVVTTNEYGLPHPSWQMNYNFAKLLDVQMNKMYPGLSRGIMIRNDGRFNQHVHNRALLIEVGSYESTEEEARRAARYLADVVAEIAKTL